MLKEFSFSATTDQWSFERGKKPSKGNPFHIRPIQKECPVQKPHRQQNRKNNNGNK